MYATCIEASQIGAQTVLQEAPQRQDVAQGGGPVRQEVLHDVVDGRGPRQGPVCGAEPHLLLCGGEAGPGQSPAAGLPTVGSRTFPTPTPLTHARELGSPGTPLRWLRSGVPQPSPNAWKVSTRKQGKTRLVPCAIRGQN